MPLRKYPIVSNEIYHIVNRGINSIPIFNDKRDYQRFVQSLPFYNHKNKHISFSKLKKLLPDVRNEYLDHLNNENDMLIEIVSYCLMPNHFHLQIKQIADNGIEEFVRLVSNSHAKYFNTKNKRKGPLFEGRYYSVRMETDEQLLHTHRYIHLNPYSSYIVKGFEDLLIYPYSSLSEYLEKSITKMCSKEIILKQFNYNTDKYLIFLKDNADYQKSLDIIKHKILE